MTDDLTPDRLDALLDGDAARTDDERDLLDVAATLRAAAPRPSPTLRGRIDRLGEPTRRARAGRVRHRATAPALAAALVALVAAGVAVRTIDTGPSGGADAPVQPTELRAATGTSPTAAERLEDSAGSAAPSTSGATIVLPAAWTVPATAIAAAVDEIRSLTAERRGTIAVEQGPPVVVTVTVAAGTRDGVAAQIAATLAAAGGTADATTDATTDAPDRLRLVLTAGTSGPPATE